MNPWHDISLGEKFPEEFPCVIEVPKGEKVKYELDKETGMIMVDRILSGPHAYPANYGLIPKTYCEDKDPLDVLVLGRFSITPLSIMNVRPVGVVKMIDQGEADDKILAVHADDPVSNDIKDLKDLPEHLLLEIKQFFEDYKKLEKKEVKISGFGDKSVAIEILKQSEVDYQKTFSK